MHRENPHGLSLPGWGCFFWTNEGSPGAMDLGRGLEQVVEPIGSSCDNKRPLHAAGADIWIIVLVVFGIALIWKGPNISMQTQPI
jgi:hypothetical protein